jgi:hypothetical protein
MTNAEKSVAQALINAGKGITYTVIYERVQKATDLPVEEVKEIAERLSQDHILWQRGGPAHNLLEGGEAGATSAAAWFEKGGAWPKEA